MQLSLGDGRAVRMIVALLAAADPLDRMAAGGDPHACYAPLAALLFDALRRGADRRRLVLLISDHAALTVETAALEPVVAFADAAFDWWAAAEARWNDPVAL